MKHTIHRVAVLGICTLLIAFCPVSALAQTIENPTDTQNTNETVQRSQAGKEEVVYANLSADGSVEGIYVVNNFDLEEAGQITDYGDYSALKNLTTSDEIVYEDGKVTINAPEGRFYYQGTLEGKPLPWTVSIHYYLDGEELDAQSLAGESGALEIRIEISKNTADTSSFFDLYTMQATVTLDAETCTEIDAPGATVANAGGNKTLAYMVLPGNGLDAVIRMQVENFSMSGIQLSAVPLSLSIDSLDISSFTGQITQLEDGIAALNDGASSLANGLGELSDGTDELKDGVYDLQSGIRLLDREGDSLLDGSSQILTALRTVVQQLKGMGDSDADGSDLATELAAFSQGLTDLADGLRTINTGLNTGLSGLDQIIAGLPTTASPEVEAALSALSGSSDPNVQTLLSAYNGQLQAAQAVSSAYGSARDQLDLLLTSLDALPGQVDTTAEAFEKVTEQLAGLAGDSGELLAPLISGLEQLSNSYREFHSGLRAYLDGVGEIADGCGDLYDGVADLNDGVVQIAQGAKELADGTQTMHSETSGMDQKIDQEIDNLFDEMLPSSSEIASFVSEENTDVKAVQFVLQTAAISAPPIETAVAPPEGEEPSFWDRLWSLFS